MENDENVKENFKVLFPSEYDEVMEVFERSGFLTFSEYLTHTLQEFMMFRELSIDIAEETIKEIELLTKKISRGDIY